MNEPPAMLVIVLFVEVTLVDETFTVMGETMVVAIEVAPEPVTGPVREMDWFANSGAVVEPVPPLPVARGALRNAREPSAVVVAVPPSAAARGMA